jgi:hypothetical protein
LAVKTEKRTDTDTGKEYTVKMADQEFYWRKHARLQDFMEKLWVEKTGRPDVELNCNDMVLTEWLILIGLKKLYSQGTPKILVRVVFSMVTNSKRMR